MSYVSNETQSSRRRGKQEPIRLFLRKGMTFTCFTPAVNAFNVALQSDWHYTYKDVYTLVACSLLKQKRELLELQNGITTDKACNYLGL